MTETEPSYVAETLAWCNTIRAESGLEPLDRLPKGERRRSASCPCGAATGFRVFSHMAFRADQEAETRIDVPYAVGTFVLAFDQGYLPQYDASIA